MEEKCNRKEVVILLRYAGRRIPTMKADEIEIKTFSPLKPAGGSHTATPSTWMVKVLRELCHVTQSSFYSARKNASREELLHNMCATVAPHTSTVISSDTHTYRICTSPCRCESVVPLFTTESQSKL